MKWEGIKEEMRNKKKRILIAPDGLEAGCMYTEAVHCRPYTRGFTLPPLHLGLHQNLHYDLHLHTTTASAHLLLLHTTGPAHVPVHLEDLLRA